VILAHETGVGPEYPLSMEKLSPILAVYTADGWEPCCDLCIRLLQYGGMGHTMAIHSSNEEIIMKFALEKPVNRILVNAPTSQGAVGYATGLVPSMTLGCGAHGGNITSDNVSAKNLILVKRMARVKPGFVDRCETPRTAPFRVGDVKDTSAEIHGDAAREAITDYRYHNRAYNAPRSETPSFRLPSSTESAGAKGAAPVQPSSETAPARPLGETTSAKPRGESTSDKPLGETAPERCPLGGGCGQCPPQASE
jgi:hypothetical protein